MKLTRNVITPNTSIVKYIPLALLLTASSNAWAQDAANNEVIYLDPFSVSTEQDNGYIASNSIAGTRTNTPISEIPLNIQVFTKELADDLLITNQVDLERYNASLINGGADPHSNNVVQQAYNQFLFRGFVQNWSLRDGVRNYDPVDSQGFERVEIVKGPMAAMYGLTYPGGVMNTISKSAEFEEDFTDVSFTLDSEGEYRATIDTNVISGEEDGVKYGVRYNGAYGETTDHREHSDGSTEFQQVNLAVIPFETTKIEFLAETAYKEQPVGLGYFYTGEIDGVDANGDPIYLSNDASIPLQIIHPDISWDWNWASGDNMRTIDNDLYRFEITQNITDDLSVNAYMQYASRNQVDSEGLNANGMGGSAASWDIGWSSSPGWNATGWQNPGGVDVSADAVPERIRMQWHHRDWQNKMHAQGISAVYNLDTRAIKNTFTAGYNNWEETFTTYKGTIHGPDDADSPSSEDDFVDFAVASGIDTSGPKGPTDNYFMDYAGAYGRENNSNKYYYAAWQMKAFNERLVTNLAVNYTKLELIQYSSGTATTPNITEESKTSPMVSAMFDITDSFSVYAVHGTSLFPTTDKNDFEEQLPVVEGSSMEFGAKMELMDGKISGTLSYYVITQEGGSQRDPDAINRNKVLWDGMTDAERIAAFPGLTRDQLTDRDGELGDLVPGGESESKGFEADIVIQATKNWQILLSYSHNSNEVTEAINEDLIGNTNSGSIDDQFSFLTKYMFEEGSLKGLQIGLGGQYAGKKYIDTTSDGTDRYDPSSLYIETFAGYKFEMFGQDAFVQFNIKNLTEQEEYVGWKATGSSDITATERYEVPTERRYSLTLGMNF